MRNTNPIQFYTVPNTHEIEFYRVDQAKGYLSNDLDLKLSLDSIAREVGVSRFHFIRMFKRHTGISPHQYRIRHRINAAKILIQ
ncbi:MAG: AraC family transcriptional regulator, partial [Desulfobacula sp.]